MRGRRRGAAFAALAGVAIVVAYVLLTGGTNYRLDLRVSNASQLVKGDLVKVGGVAVGTISEITLDDDGVARVRTKLTDGDLTPLHAGTRAEVRVPSLSSVAARFVSLTPGPNSGAELDDGATIAAEDVDPAVEIDAVLSALDAQTRTAAQALLRGQDKVFEGQEAAANRGLRYLAPALSQLQQTSAELAADDVPLGDLLVRGAAVTSAVASRDADLETALEGAATTAETLANERATLTSVLREAPRTLDDGSDVLRRLRTTFATLRPVARELQPVAPRAARLTTELQPLLRRSGPAIDDVRALLPDLTGALQAAPGLRDTAIPSLKALRTALAGAQPIVDGLLPYLPDVYHGVVSGFGGQQVSSYDANGAYARVQPIAGTTAATGGGSVVQNLLPATRTGQNRRCPGGAYDPVAGNDTPAGSVGCDKRDAP